MQFLLAPENHPFVIALLVMFGIALFEGVASVLGAGFSGALESLLPEMDGDVTASSGSAQGAGLFSRLLGWLQVGKVPVLMVLIILLTVYGLVGLVLQWVLNQSIGIMVPGWWLSIPVLLLSLPIVQASAVALYRLLPGDETDAVSDTSFVGRLATITLGRARAGSPAQARLQDEHGQTHYLMLEPHDRSDEFEAGEEVLVVEKRTAVFAAVRNTSEALSQRE